MNPKVGGPCQGIRNYMSVKTDAMVFQDVVSLDDPAEPFLLQDSFRIIALGPSKGPWQYSSQLTPWLHENLHRYDAVVVHGLWLYHGYAVRKAIQRLKDRQEKAPKLFMMTHGMLDPYFQRASDRKLKALRNWLYWKLIEHKSVEAADGLFFTCQKELQLARKPFWPYHPRREINVGFGIEAPPAFKRTMETAFLEKCVAVAGRPYLLFLSRIHEKKGVEMLVEAYATLLETALDPEALPALVIAGPGLETPYGRKIWQTVQNNPLLRASVFFPGMLSGDAKWGALYGAEAFVLPSHQENFGIAVVEAMACGRPVLISNQINICDEIEQAGAGLVQTDTLPGTKALLQQWLDRPVVERQQMARRAYQTYVANFSVTPAVSQFCEAIQS